jgi:hypothetical protein
MSAIRLTPQQLAAIKGGSAVEPKKKRARNNAAYCGPSGSLLWPGRKPCEECWRLSLALGEALEAMRWHRENVPHEEVKP